MPSIPLYALYGEPDAPDSPALHIERISCRSAAHGWDIHAHRHEGLLQWLYLQKGAGTLLVDDRRQRVRAPCVVYLPSFVVHGFAWDGQVEGEVITAQQHPLEGLAKVISPALAEALQQPAVVPLPRWGARTDPLRPLLAALHDEAREPGRDHLAASMGVLLNLMVQTLRHQPAPCEDGGSPSRRGELAQRFRLLVERHYREHRPLPQYARELGLTMTTLGRLCQEHLGASPIHLVNARLMLEARRALAHSPLSVKEIAHDLGFADVGYFSRFFRKHAQMSPSEFRLCR